MFFVSHLGWAQDVLDELVSVQYPHIKIHAFLDSIHQNYNVDFSYDPSVIPSDSSFVAVFDKQSLEEVLSIIFKNHHVGFESVDRQIIITTYQREVFVKDFILLTGVVVSAKNDQLLPLVNLALKDEPIGTTTNMEGQFEFLIPEKFIGKKIYFSSIGFEADSMTIPEEDTIIQISLDPQTVRLKEVEVRYLIADDIVKNFLKNKEKNYPVESALHTAFFRETIRQDGKFIEASEAILDIYKSSYLKTFDNEKVRFVRGRKRVEDTRVSYARLRLAGGPVLFSRIDVAKHLDFISEANDKNYFYMNKGKEVIQDRVVYKVGFKPVVELEDIYYEGDLYFDIESFALICAEFSMTKRTLRQSEKYLIQKQAKKVKSSPVFTHYYIDYRAYNNKWILNRVSGELIIRIHDKRNKVKSEYLATAEMIITDSEAAAGRRIKYSESFKPNYVLAKEIVDYDPDFWKNYNVIKPEEDLEKVFKASVVDINVVPKPKKTKP